MAGLLLTWLTGCEPNRSDVVVEVVSPTIAASLMQSADSVGDLSPDTILSAAWPMLIAGKVAYKGNKRTEIWSDEQDRILLLLESVNGIRTDSVPFFTNGQRAASLIFDNQGRLSGRARFYHSDGRVSMDGRYEAGLRSGIWRQFDTEGLLLRTQEYDRAGQPKR